MVLFMEINQVLTNNQVRQLRNQATELRNVRSLLLQYQDNLRSVWKGEDIKPVSKVIDSHVEKLTAIASELESIGTSITKEATMLAEVT